MRNSSGSLSNKFKIKSRIICNGFKVFVEELFKTKILKHDALVSGPDESVIKNFERIKGKTVKCAVSELTYVDQDFILDSEKITHHFWSFTLFGAVNKAIQFTQNLKNSKEDKELFFLTIPRLSIKKGFIGYKCSIGFRYLEGEVTNAY